MRNLATLSRDGNSFSIDEEDYRIIKKIHKKLDLDPLDSLDHPLFECRVGVREHDCERRVSRLVIELHDAYFYLFELPVEIGGLTSLEELDISGVYTTSTSLPSSVGQLKNLKILIADYMDLKSLPDEIGGLTNLEKLHMQWSSIKTLPPSSIGQLTKLTALDLTGTKIKYLPPSIGQLTKLKELSLAYTEDLTKLPEEIGGLTSLEELDLEGANIDSLPQSIGNLRNLKICSDWTYALSELPDDKIGGLVSLKVLILKDSSQEKLLLLTQGSTFLGCLGFYSKTNPLDASIQMDIGYALACNRARSRIKTLTSTPKLWPFLLKNATNAFDEYTDSFCSYPSILTQCKIQEADAIFWFLTKGTRNYDRESFVLLIRNRSS